MEFSVVETLIISIIVVIVGFEMVRRIDFLKKYSIPAPAVGGLIFAIITTIIYSKTRQFPQFDMSLRAPLMSMFFATIGLSASFSALVKGGKKVFLFLISASFLLVFQNIFGVGIGRIFDLPIPFGLLAGSITLSGGHGTGAAWAYEFINMFGDQGYFEMAMAAATFGLIMGALIGGPVGEYLINTYKLKADEMPQKQQVTQTQKNYNISENFSIKTFISHLLIISLCLYMSQLMPNKIFIQQIEIIVPAFVWAIFTGIFIRNFCEILGITIIKQRVMQVFAGLSLILFLSMSLISIKLWQLIDLAAPLISILAAQAVLMALWSVWVTFPLLGKNYTAAVISAGHCGFGMGATPVAMANMTAITDKHGPSPQAFFIVPLVAAFFIDILNAIIIQIFLSFN